MRYAYSNSFLQCISYYQRSIIGRKIVQSRNIFKIPFFICVFFERNRMLVGLPKILRSHRPWSDEIYRIVFVPSAYLIDTDKVHDQAGFYKSMAEKSNVSVEFQQNRRPVALSNQEPSLPEF